jgi:hypothetical protein
MIWNGTHSFLDRYLGPLLVLVILVVLGRADGGEPAPAGNEAEAKAKVDAASVEFFEKSVRPILATRCQSCHGPNKQKGGLRLDARAAILAGGTTGPAVVPGNPKESLLVDAINYGETYQMPPKSKLPAAEIATLTDWVQKGAPWGVETPARPSNPRAAKEAGKSDQVSRQIFQERAKYWSFQPIRRVTPSTGSTERPVWARNPIDRFILAALEQRGLTPAPEAEKRTLIRRLSFDLTGLPPSPVEVEAFLRDSSPGAYESLVERLLASPQYGERWARHWLDLVRFAETAGHEFDYDIPNAFRYRDYVIRALNADLPYNQFVIEQIAGDLLDAPRRHPAEGFKESILGTGFYFLGEGTHSPVDVREDEMRRIDNQIDVISKTFLGLTVACARCHDHKFDPITNKDYYALAGFLHSSRYQQAPIDSPAQIAAGVTRLRSAKETIVTALRDAKASLPEPIRSRADETIAAGKAPISPATSRSERKDLVFEDFHRDSYDGWSVTGDAFGERPSVAGDLRLVLDGRSPRLVTVPAGLAHSGLDSDRLVGVIRSRTFTIEHRFIHTLVAGQGGKINVLVDGFEKIRDPIYGGLTITVNHGDQPRWLTQDVGMWLGHTAYLEIADGAVADFSRATTQIVDGHGYIAVVEIRMSNGPAPTMSPPGSGGEIDLGAVVGTLRSARSPLADRLTAALEAARTVEASLADPALALCIADGTGVNERIHIRGSHKNLGEVVPRRFLEVLGGIDSSTSTSVDGSGRLELAQRMVDPSANPLLPRVLVNRIWKHLFGEGIVKSTDDFGAMGQKPSHPELLDWLAAEFIARGWSIKQMQRLMVTSSTYRMTSVQSQVAERFDPPNTYLHRMNVRRLEAEAIRDTLLSVSGRLEPTLYGASVPVYLSRFMEGRGRPGRSGPLDGDGRRSIYLNVRRNFLHPMFLAFDAPVPFSTMGRRNVSNVPAQALTLMNDPMVAGQARLWAERVLAGAGRSARARLDALYMSAFSRPPTEPEALASLAFLDGQDQSVLAWADLCHVLINMKEFIFVD